VTASQSLLQQQIEQLRHAAAQGGDSSTLIAAEQQLSRLAGLQHHIVHGGDLATLRAAVRATVDAVQGLVPQTRNAAATGTTAELALHQATAHARQVTNTFVHDFYERRIFDPYLSFASAEEEQAYRDREEARQRAIAEARARGTPEGDLLALRLGREQLEDAARFGADRSPDYAGLYSQVSSAERDLRGAMGPVQRERSIAVLDEAPTPQPAISPDVLASLRQAGVTIAENDAPRTNLPDVRTPDAMRTPG